MKIDQIRADSPGSVTIGPFGSRMKSELYTPVGVPVIRGQNISDARQFCGEFVFVSPETADSLRSCLVYPDDLVFPHRGSIGLVALVPHTQAERYMMSTSLMKLTCDKRVVDPAFVFYFFRSQRGRDELLKRASTVGTPGIGQPLRSLKSIEIPVPPLAEQQAIGALLGAIDHKIAANDRITFTTFEFAECKYRQIASRSTSSLTVGDVLDLKYGKALPTADRIAGEVPVYGSGGITGTHDKALVEGPGVVVGRKGTVGAVYWSAEKFFAIDTTFYAALRRDVPMEYAFFMLRGLGLGAMNSDSAVPGLNRSNVLALPVRVPDEEDLRTFQAAARPLFTLHHGLDAESSALAKLRDSLVPPLMSGDIRVRDAEKIVEDAT